MARDPGSVRGAAFSRVPWLAMRAPMVATGPRGAERPQLLAAVVGLLHLGVGGLGLAVEGDQPLLVERRIRVRVAAVPVGPHAELLDGPVHGAVEPRQAVVDAEVVVDEVVLELVGALLLDGAVAVGLGA